MWLRVCNETAIIWPFADVVTSLLMWLRVCNEMAVKDAGPLRPFSFCSSWTLVLYDHFFVLFVDTGPLRPLFSLCSSWTLIHYRHFLCALRGHWSVAVIIIASFYT